MSELKKVNEKEFQPKYLYTDVNRFDAYKKDYEKKVPILNSFIVEVEKVLNRKLTDQEKQKAIIQKLAFVENELKPKFQFKEATKEFNYTTLGVDLSTLQALEIQMNRIASIYKYNILNGLFVSSENELKAIENQLSIYTDNQLQNERLVLVNEAVELFQKFKDAGLVKEHAMQNIDSVFPTFKVGRINGNLQIVGDHKTLKYMR